MAPTTATTKSRQLRDYLIDKIKTDMRPHDRLPTERDLAERFSVSRLTVRLVLDRMETEGRVYRIQGAGTFVAEPRIAKSLELASFTEDMSKRGLKAGSRMISMDETLAGARIGFRLNLSPADHVLRITRVRTADDAPMCLENCYLPARLVPGLADRSLEGSLYEMLATDFHIELERAEQSIRCTVLDPKDAELLEVPPLSPAFAVERTAYDNRGRAVEHAVALYRGDRYAYHLTLHRTPDQGG